MLLDFFYHLRHRGLKPSTREFLTLLEALKADVISPSIDDFYFLSKATLVKALMRRLFVFFVFHQQMVTGNK